MILQCAFDGSFYPAERAALEEVVDLCLERAQPLRGGRIVGALVPHAGYIYSGRTAGTALGALRGAALDAVVVLGPSHRVPVRGCRVFRVDGYETPLGPVAASAPVRDALLDQLGAQARGGAFAEHSIEVQLPLLQRALPGVPVVAVAFGPPDRALAEQVGAALATLSQQWRLVVVASSDLSHYYDREHARRLDARFRATLEAADLGRMAQALEQGEVEACGAGPVLTLLALAGALQARICVLDATDSSAVSGDSERVVGYLSALAVAGAHS